MLALIYLGLAICVGERLCGHFYRFVSTSHRWATGTLVGLVLSTSFTYLAARHFASASNPLLLGNILFLVAASIFLLNCPSKRPLLIQPQASKSETWSWIVLGIYCAFACWMMFATLDYKAGNLLVGVTQWSDYGPNTAIVQSFAHGHNFPAEYPHWAGESIRTHFLFYFLAGNLEFLGLNLAWSLNIISVLTLVCMLALVMALGQVLFKSRSVGFIASALFFFHGTLNLVPFLRKQTSFKGALNSIYTLHDYLSSGFPYRGEDWGIWTQVVFINQRHLANSIGIFLIVLIFLFDRYLEAAKQRQIARALRAGRRPIRLRTTEEPPIAAGIPARREDGAWATDAASEGDAQMSDELRAIEQSSLAPETIATSEGQLPGPVESHEQTSPAAPYGSAEETRMPDTLAYDEGSRPEPENMTTGGGPLPGPVESLEESFPAANYASADETPTRDTLAYDEQSRPEPETTATSEVEPSGPVESLEESSQAAHYASTGEAQPFATRAADEYMPPELDTTSVSEAQEAEALEFAKQSSWEAGTASLSEAQSQQALVPEPVPRPSRGLIADLVRDSLVSGKGFIFSGLLLGALPYWNAPVFTAAAAVLAFLFILFPCRRYMVGLGITAALVSLPQILALRSGNARSGASLIHWGYTLGNVPVSHVLKYLGWTFGVKWVLILVALLFFSWRNLRLFIALFSLFLLTFCLQFSEEGLANHKFINIWLVVANLFAAYGFWRLWRLGKKAWAAIPLRLVALVLVTPIVVGGIIDFFPIHNASFIVTSFGNDRLIKWLQTETKGDAIFLTDRFVNHPILLAGRRIFFGYTYFTWSAGYDLPKREIAYKQMWESKNAQQVFTLLKANGIDYVAYDAGIRGQFKNHNEQEVYIPNFKKVFDGADYWSLAIYKVPENADFVAVSAVVVPGSTPAPKGISVFDGSKGKENGQFDFPRGLAVDSAGNILVSDTNNGRLQKFSPAGIFHSVIGKKGQGQNEFREPSGIAVDPSGHIYVADFSGNCVKKLKPDGTFLAELKGPDPGFHGPRDVAIGEDNSLYVTDQGHQRIVKFDSNGKVVVVWGTAGQGDGQFSEISSIAVDATNRRVYVADPRNGRIEVFDTNGKFLAKWPVEQWTPTAWFFQGLAVDGAAGRLYASSPTDEVLVFDLMGKQMGALRPNPPDKLEGASCLALVKGKLYVLNTYASHLSWIGLEKK